jgi:hypothetical protein
MGACSSSFNFDKPAPSRSGGQQSGIVSGAETGIPHAGPPKLLLRSPRYQSQHAAEF